MPAAKFVALMLEHLKNWHAENLSLGEIFWIAPFKLKKQIGKVYVRSEFEDGRLNLVVCDDEHEYVTATAIERHVERWAVDELATESDIFANDGDVLNKNDIYLIFIEHGLDYGEYFKVIEKAIATEQEVYRLHKLRSTAKKTMGQTMLQFWMRVFQAVVLLHTKQSNYDVRISIRSILFAKLSLGRDRQSKKVYRSRL